MKKILLGIIAIIAILGLLIFVNKWYYPQSPVDNLSQKEILNKLNNSDEKVVLLSKEEDNTWYITKSNNNGILDADEEIKKMISSKGWSFKEKDGNGLFFEKDGETLIASTQMWTKKYVIVQVSGQL
ncbi:hypothetical protein ABET51_18695 [Metabacillus fastidiosus]|uniref:hypothetical protein n=1 Tax=Metabacillus fastidiosus TaxID=1458 RepID=UPI002E1DC66B|nr:hypothetical protein [Metabacillus fastidiosus]